MKRGIELLLDNAEEQIYEKYKELYQEEKANSRFPREDTIITFKVRMDN